MNMSLSEIASAIVMLAFMAASLYIVLWARKQERKEAER
jgi:preprotein translocase subunit YajC